MDDLETRVLREPTFISASRPDREPPAYVVGIAASIGQRETLEFFFTSMPVDSGMAFLIIQPSSADGTSITREMLSRHTEMSIHVAEDGMAIQRDSVYLIQHETMIVVGGRLQRIESDSSAELTLSTDSLFHSLAQDVGERAIGVVHLGSLRDGFNGLLEIGKAGGIVIAVDETAKFDAMPRAPVEAGFVDLLLPPSKIAEALLKYANCPSELGGADHRHGALTKNVSNLFSSTEVGTIFIDGQLCVRKYTPNATRNFQITPQDVGRRLDSVVHNLVYPGLVGDIADVAETGRTVEREVRDSLGNWFFVRMLSNPSTEALDGVVMSLYEISPLRQARNELNAVYDALNSSINGVLIVDLDWTLMYTNAAFQRMFEFDQDTLYPGKKLTELFFADTLDKFDKICTDVLGGQDATHEHYIRRSDGTTFAVLVSSSIVTDADGQAAGRMASFVDITERKKAEAELEQYAAEIKCANETLRIAEEEARKAVINRDRFLAMLSHELRNPLSAMLNGIGVLEHTGADREAVAKARHTIRRQVQHMSRLLDDLLDVARVTQGKIDFRKTVLDLNDLVWEAGQTVQPAMEARRQQLAVIPALGPVMVEGDPTRLLQIVGNLLINASKYTPSEEVISLELRKEEEDCEVWVRDNGRGIDPDMLDEIFDMFFQSDHAVDRSDGGMGVGLTLVRALVEMHGGTVTAHSEGLGKGSQFVVRLPLTSKPPAVSAELPSVATDVITRVLLVEDNPDSRDMLQAILTLEGFQVEVAEDGQQGLDAVFTLRPDVALIDIGLPELDGYEVARRVRKQLDRSEVQLVALTGYGQAEDRAAVFQAGFDEHLVKPINPEDLARVLRRPRKPR